MTFAPTLLGGGLAGYAYLDRTRVVQQERFAASPQVAREVDAARTRLTEVQTVDDLMGDRPLLTVVLGAFGLESDLGNPGFIRAVFESDLEDPRSLANRLSDRRYLDLAQSFDFGGGAPRLPGEAAVDPLAEELAQVRSADDLLGNRTLLRATLDRFGLGDVIGNTFFLSRVLESDTSDPASFASRLSHPRYAELAEAVGLARKAAAADGLYGFAARIGAREVPVATADNLLGDPELLSAALSLYGLDADADRSAFLRDVLNSDMTDPQSVANAQDDPRYAALARAFGIAARAEAETVGDTYVSRVETLADLAETRTPIDRPGALFEDPRLMLAVYDIFDLPSRPDQARFTARVLSSDGADPVSLVNVFPDPRYNALHAAFSFPPETETRSYPTSFAASIVDAYVERQFEVRVGEQDTSLRLALSMERELQGIVAGAQGNDSRWFAVMASRPMRTVFETVFGLPSSFGTLDVDRQLSDLKARARSAFGTDLLAEIVAPSRVEELRDLYLRRGAITASPAITSAGSAALALLTRGAA